MMQRFFQSVEQWFGASLATTATVVYWLAMALLAHRILSPILRLRMEMLAAGLRMEQGLILECPACHRETVVHDKQCAFCRKSIELPWSLKFWHFFQLRRRPKWLHWLRWGVEGLALLLFLALTIAGFIALGAWRPEGSLHQLFVGAAILCWVAIGWFAGRALHLGLGGPLGRLRDAVFAFAATGVLSLCLFLADESRIVPEAVLWRLPVGEGGMVRVADKSLSLPQGLVGFEYLQIDHELLGYHRVVPMAFLGANRLELDRGRVEKWLLDTLRARAQGYSERGLSVRSRVEQFMVAPNQEYEIVERNRQVFFRPKAP